MPTAFPFHTNLDFDIREAYEYKTTIIPSRDRHEQRASLRTNPRRTIEYVITAHNTPTDTGKIRRLLHSTIFGAGKGPYDLPIWSDAVVLSGITSGTTTLTFDTTAKDLVEDGKGILWKSETEYEYVDVSDVELAPPSQPRDITISAAANTYSGNVIFAPVRTAYLSADFDIQSITSNREHVTLPFELKTFGDEALTPNPITNRSNSKYQQASFAPLYLGVELFDLFSLRQAWKEEEGYQATRYEDRHDYGNGAWSAEDLVTGFAQNLGLNVTVTDKTVFQNLLGWFTYHQGRRIPLWVPTWQDDLKVTGISGNDITIEQMGYTDNYNLHEARRDVCFIEPDGTMTPRRITACVDGGATETLTLDGAPVADAMCSFLVHSRLDHDRLELQYRDWSRGGAVQTTLKFQQLMYS